MKKEELKAHREEGKRVWESLLGQMAEGSGFLQAMLGSFRQFIKKQFLPLILYGIIAALLAGAIWYLKPKEYEAEMTVSYIHYEKKIYADMLEKLDRLVQSGSYVPLAGLLELPPEQVTTLKEIKSYNIRRETLTEDLSTERIPFYIAVKVRDISLLDDLQAAIVDYLNGTEFIQERLGYMRQKSEEELAFLEKRLAVIDSLSSIVQIREDKMLSEKTITRMELLEETLALFNKIQEVKGSLTFNHNIEILDGFVANDRPAGKRLTYWIFYGFFAGICLRLLVLVFA